MSRNITCNLCGKQINPESEGYISIEIVKIFSKDYDRDESFCDIDVCAECFARGGFEGLHKIIESQRKEMNDGYTSG